MTKTLKYLMHELKGKTLLVSVGDEKFDVDLNDFDSYSHEGMTFIKVTASGKTRYINQAKIKYFEIT
ncbi:TPA: hypothetical protein KKW55_001452 [Legionella pneumophila]|uniref:hypothetical protein n=1 Tax=Legionella sp. PC997 TaxID=2755562 RepID=UPI0005B3856B|nr:MULTISPECIES: hypothetical protein [Legionella]QMT59216.1 hypothetical protein HBNCFIEN_00577 [Legionella sp. PC997]HAT1864827.1 hypothetical protein [Legionella pneumophila]HAT1875117.1 hypothetical protein [Legionella pneumophila]HAT1972274.1 hypothetical protein [Legionella pneumophila]HAT2145022.1 hypothetical protein [Legionella pneumophila]